MSNSAQPVVQVADIKATMGADGNDGRFFFETRGVLWGAIAFWVVPGLLIYWPLAHRDPALAVLPFVPVVVCAIDMALLTGTRHWLHHVGAPAAPRLVADVRLTRILSSISWLGAVSLALLFAPKS